MRIRINNLFFVAIAFMGIIISNSQVVLAIGKASVIQYLSYLVLILCIVNDLLKNNKHIVVYKLGYLFLIIFLFTIGICQQILPITTKIYLSISMMIISVLATLPISLIKDIDDFRRISNHLLFALFITSILGIMMGATMFTGAVEGIGFSQGFNGGLTHKNFFGITILMGFVLTYLAYKYGSYKRTDRFILGLELFLILISNTRSVYLILLLFLFLVNLDKIKIEQRQWSTLKYISMLFCAIFLYYFFGFLITHSDSYTHRVNGLINFFEYYRNDWFHLMFGAADLAYGDLTLDYAIRVRRVLGWNGTLEMPLLSIMLKNGFIGLVGYGIVLYKLYRNVRILKTDNIKTIGKSVFIIVVLSATVENYIVNLSFVFMPICFCLLNSISTMESTINKQLQT
ncbi:oligosaccharide repeat unit polymerase Wzy [Streptococcus suis]|uniref:oligosaccharide repeat unit polymerase Wzy n=1 Tax=Streptococcus suis TaxID=1307 RepID=UPI0005CF3444|nr:oligosaccharide repeat unit polymerase Wzy [Streptococcus suis]